MYHGTGGGWVKGTQGLLLHLLQLPMHLKLFQKCVYVHMCVHTHTHTHITLVSLLFLEHVKQAPTSGPLQILFSLPEMLFFLIFTCPASFMSRTFPDQCYLKQYHLVFFISLFILVYQPHSPYYSDVIYYILFVFTACIIL